MQVHLTQPDGDVLVFLTGQEEIEACEELLRQVRPCACTSAESLCHTADCSSPHCHCWLNREHVYLVRQCGVLGTRGLTQELVRKNLLPVSCS